MTADELLRLLYMREKPFLQTNDWAGLKIRIADLIGAAGPLANADEVVDLLRSLRLDGRLMFLPDWTRWGLDEDEADGSLVPSRTQWEPNPGTPDPPSWVRRQVFMPEDLKHWFVRSRIAETARLLFANRERFGLEAATAHLGYELQERERPDRTATAVPSVVERLKQLTDQGIFSKASDREALKLALHIVGTGLKHSHIAAFQERAWEAILRSLLAEPRQIDATMITAGVSSGKTLGFLLPTLTLLVYRALCGEGRRNRALVIYPRTSLVEDQYHGLRALLAEINAQLTAVRPGIELADRPALDAGQMLAQSLGLESSSLAETLPQVEQRGIEIILTTPESLKNRMLDPRAVSTYLSSVEVVVLDEIHLLEGLAGCHGIYFIRRLRQLMRTLRGDPQFEPAWVGASATVAEPTEHCSRVLSLDPTRVAHISPTPNELIPFGLFHHIFLHTRVGKPSISAVTNGLSCLTHTRNDCTAFAHYVDPAAANLQHRSTGDVPKTIAFVDSLSTIGRLRFTTADNERTYQPHVPTPPYYTWFYRPAARFGATAGETRSIGATRLNDVRQWCQKCYHGIPARIDGTAFKSPEFAYLRTGHRMDEKAKARSRPPGFSQELQRLSGPVGNLDECPFHKFRICWWFSQDSGELRTIGNGQIRIDQNRAIAYTSKTDDDLDLGLHENVNDYFLTTARKLWQQADGLPSRDEAVSTLLASPRIEVGVDFRNVRDGATHKAMRSAASFQQKVGRVGREDRSDSVILTFLAHRPTDAHFAHHPARLIDSEHLDPIPLKSENLDVLKNHMFAAGLEYVASRSPGTIPSSGRELNIIGTGSSRVPVPWEGKVRACIAFIEANRASVRAYMLAATKQDAASRSIADETIGALLVLLRIFVADLAGAYTAGGTAAHWFKENHVLVPSPAFSTVLEGLRSLTDRLRQASSGVPSSVQAAIDALQAAANVAAPNPSELTAAATVLTTTASSAISGGLSPAIAGQLMIAAGDAQSTAVALQALQLGAPLEQLRHAHEIIQAFFQETEPTKRMMQQYYLHDILTRFLPFRRFYPFGLVRTHFQHINARQVQVSLPNGDKDLESLSTALYELLPGTWNYRWLGPRKSPCGPINQLAGTGEHYANLANIEGPTGAAFETTGVSLSATELPPDMPAIPSGVIVPIVRPIRLEVTLSYHQPDARYDNSLIGDDDESSRIDDLQLKRACPTLPRAFPATWYRVAPDPVATPVIGRADPSNATYPLAHTMPAIGRVLFDNVTYSSNLGADRYVYAIDRSYGSGGIESPRIHYRRGTPPHPVVIGETLGKTDGLTFHLRSGILDTVIEDVVVGRSSLSGEITIRAIRRFVAQATGCGPFRAEMIRKVLLMEHLDAGANLDDLDAHAVQTYFSRIDRRRYDTISGALVNGIFAGVDPVEAAAGRARQLSWYGDAWESFQSVQTVSSSFDTAFISGVARDILVHSLAVTTLDGLSRLVGAADGDLAYFHRPHENEFYVFDSVEGGNGCAETIERFLQVPPLRRILAARSGTSSTLPSSDGFMLIEEAIAPCPAQATTRLLAEACRQRIADAGDLRFPTGLAADLQARIRHEFDPVTGSRNIVEHLLDAQPTVFRAWPDLLWLQVLPERFADALVQARICPNVESVRLRTHLCVTGCLECVDNADQSIYGALTSREYVSKNLLDVLRQRVVASEPHAFLPIPAGTDVGATLQANAGRPVADISGAPVTATIDDQGTPRQILLTQVLSTVSPDLGVAGGRPLLTQVTGSSAWQVNIPFLAGYRDERPI